ncbi:tRNA 2-thiouridine(34) synthase MnmA [Bartonella sp. DGB1]|uniref:tRNA 2-thiouridine(34) synthase MnmA n=1 Tax=Bartonella sp. DGB1 TaxID=3239807 RepID=UPI003526AFAB
MELKLNSLDLALEPHNTRVVVAMSGGVDSSVVAGILKHEGYNVIGITLQLYDHGTATHRIGSCCAGQDIEDAKKVCEKLDIPHYVLNYEKKFQESVINPFAQSYIDGQTPVPCIACNQTVKFSDLLNTAKELGADVLATGHYVKTKINGNNRSLFRPLDIDKDQSYFLFATTQEQLNFLRFPLGYIPKSKVREIAQQMGLEVAKKQDSQDICFVPQGKYTDIIANMKPNAIVSGDIRHIDGRILGKHNGIIHYTIGQRRGLGISTGDALYVVHLDHKNNRVIVGPSEALKIYKIFLRDINWLGDEPLDELKDKIISVYAKVRSTHKPKKANLHCDSDGKIWVEFIEEEKGIAPGQACVFYSDDTNNARVYGGGFISHTNLHPKFEAALAELYNR